MNNNDNTMFLLSLLALLFHTNVPKEGELGQIPTGRRRVLSLLPEKNSKYIYLTTTLQISEQI